MMSCVLLTAQMSQHTRHQSKVNAIQNISINTLEKK